MGYIRFDTAPQSYFVFTTADRLDSVPDVEDVRPKCCSICGALAHDCNYRVIIQGHGVRERMVVVPARWSDEYPRTVECWARRYRCVKCGAVVTVLPKGVLPRFLYSVMAVVVAFFRVAAQPVGEGLTQAQAYDCQGMLRGFTSRTQSEPSYRWRSLKRWERLAREWWKSWTGPDISHLLLGFLKRSVRNDLMHAVDDAISSHARWGWAM